MHKNTRRTTVRAAAISLAAMTASAQWTSQLLNDHAVTNELGEMVILWDEGGYYEGNPAYAPDKSFDGNTGTFYDSSIGGGQGGWAGFELQSPKLITRVRYVGRNGQVARMMGIRIQGANLPDFSDAVTLWTIMPPAGWNPTWWRDESFPSRAVLTPFKYVRFIAQPGMAGGNLCMVQFYGADPMSEEAPAPNAPTLTFEACINQRMNLFWTGAPLNAILYEIQRKIEHERRFSPLAYVFAATGEQHFFDESLMLYRDTTYRIRAVNCIGHSPWTYSAASPLNSGRGQWIGPTGSWDPTMTGDKIFDGNVQTFYNSPNGQANGAWSGLDFGDAREITMIRFVPRRDTNGPRINGAWFEVADNPDFINASTLYTLPAGPTPSFYAITEQPISPPVTTRYARFCSPDGSYGNVAEVEFVLSAQPPLPPTSLAVTTSDLTNTYAVLSWRLHDAGSLISSVLVYRATSPGGPYDLMTPEGLYAEQEWTDTTARIPGICYYYRLTSLWNVGSGSLESKPGPHVAHTPYVRLERDWSDLTQIKYSEGMTLLGLEYTPHLGIGGGHEIQAMFDNNAQSFPDTSPSPGSFGYNAAVGVNLAKPYCIYLMRFVGRHEYTSRLSGAELRGSNDPDYTNNFTRLATFANAPDNWQYVTQQTQNQKPFRYIFVQRADNGQFYGNVAELELYGWDPAPASAVPVAPALVTPSIHTDGIRLDWEAGTAQDAYRIQRSTDGINWTDLGDTSGNTFTDTSPPIGQQTLYRIAAVHGQPEELAFSDDYPIITYTAGYGTGLTATYFTNYFLGYSTDEGFAGTFTENTPNWMNPNIIRSEIPASVNDVRIVWTGKLIVPFTGDYTFYLTSDDGVVLQIDGEYIINHWFTRGAATDQATVHLTAGEHLFRMDYFQEGGGRAMILEWGGAVDRCVIPTAQLVPHPLPANEDVFIQTGAWTGRTFGAGRLGFHTLNPDGSVTLHHADSEIGGGNERFHYVWQTVRGDFSFEAQVDQDRDLLRNDGKALLMVRNDLPRGNPFLAISTITTNENGRFNVKQRLEPNTNITDALAQWTGPFLNPCHLRVKRVKSTFTFDYRETDPGSPWVTIHTFEDTEGIFKRDLYAGLAVCAPTQGSQKMFQTATFSDIRFTRLNTGSLIILK